MLPYDFSNTEGSTEAEGAVADVDVTDAIADQVNVDVLPYDFSITEGSIEAEGSAADVGLTDLIVEEAGIEVLPYSESTAGTGIDLPLIKTGHDVLTGISLDSTIDVDAQIKLPEGSMDTELEVVIDGGLVTDGSGQWDIIGDLVKVPTIDLSDASTPIIVVTPTTPEIPMITETETPQDSLPDGETPSPGNETPGSGSSSGTLDLNGNTTLVIDGVLPNAVPDTPDFQGDDGHQSYGNMNGAVTQLVDKNASSSYLSLSSHSGQHAASLPKTGGLLDGNILFVLALLLMIAGFALRKTAASTMNRSVN